MSQSYTESLNIVTDTNEDAPIETETKEEVEVQIMSKSDDENMRQSMLSQSLMQVAKKESVLL